MSLRNADLPSEDEEDDDYRPDLDTTAEKEDRAEFIEKVGGGKRARCAPAWFSSFA